MQKLKLVFFLALFVGCTSRPLPVLGDVPDFSLTDQTGTKVDRQKLLGKVWVADFIYTGCGGVCPLLTQKMSELNQVVQKSSDAASIHFVSFSVDPENDTPERLFEYADNFHVDSRHWSFLTGPYQEIEKAVVQGFKVAMGKDANFQVLHGEKFVLVDQKGRIRGYYDANQEGLKSLQKAILQLTDKSCAPDGC